MVQTWNGDVGHDLVNVASDIGGWLSGPPGDPGRIRQCASQIEALRDRLDGDRRALNESVDELTMTWTGGASGAFHATWYEGAATSAPATVLEGAYHALDQFGRRLYDYADQLQHAQEEHWISMGIMAALTIVNAVQLGADPATDAAEVGVATGTAAGTSFALADVGTMAINGAMCAFTSDVVSQLGADLLDELTPGFDRTGDHAVSAFSGEELVISAVAGGATGALLGGGTFAISRISALAPAAGRGLSDLGGVFTPEENAAGGTVWTSAGTVSQKDVAGLVNSGMYRGNVSVISGVHGFPDGTTAIDESLYNDDVLSFGTLSGVNVYNLPAMTPEDVTALLAGPGTTIGAFCNSGACLAPFR